jgi:ribosomal protein S6
VEFEAEPEFPIELERIYRITEGVLKGLIVKKED